MSGIRAMVMAAGAGTRLRPLTNDLPKPMVPIANRPVLEYTVENLRRHGITDIIFNLHSYPELIRDHFGDGSRFGVSISYSHEPKLLGTAGGVKKVEWFLKDNTFLVLSGDGLTTVNVTRLLRFHREKRSVATMGLKAVDTRFDYGVTLTQKNGRIKRFIEKPLWGDVFSSEVNSGIYVFEPSIFKAIPPGAVYDFGKQVWPKLLKSGAAIYGFPFTEYWCDVGNVSEYRRAQCDFLDGTVGLPPPGKRLRPGIWVEEGAHIDAQAKLAAPCLIGRHARIEAGAFIGPHSVIGPGAKVMRKASVKNSTLWADAQVGHSAALENTILAAGAQVPARTALFDALVTNRRAIRP